MLSKVKTVYYWASLIALVGALALFAASLWRYYSAAHAVEAVYGADTNGDKVPDSLDPILSRISDPKARASVRLTIVAIEKLVVPDHMDDPSLKLAVFDYYSALDCLHAAYGNKMDRVEKDLLKRMLLSEELKRRFANRTSQAISKGYLPQIAPGFLCPL